MRNITELSLINRDSGYSKQSYNPEERHNRGLRSGRTYGSLALKEDSNSLTFSELLEMEFAESSSSVESVDSVEQAALQTIKGLWA